MILHTHKVISKLFNKYFDKLSELRSINLLGPSGLGKLFYIKEFIRHIQCDQYKPFFDVNSDYYQNCNCSVCRGIIDNNVVDILILWGNEKIDEVRRKVNDFVDSYPVEYKYRFLIVQNLQKFNNHELDVFLNILEDPPKHVKIFTTSDNFEGVSYSIRSRLHSFELSYLVKDHLKVILESNSELEAYLSILDKYDFKTIDQLIYYNKFAFEELFSKLFSKVESSYGLEVELNKFLDLIKEQNELQSDKIIVFFIEFYIKRMYEFCDLNKENIKIQYFKEYVEDKVVFAFSQTLFKQSDFLKQRYINIRTQLFLFFNLIYTVRKIMEV